MAPKKTSAKGRQRRTVAKRNRRTLAQIFTDQLADLSGNGQQLVSNHTLRDALDWDEERYARIKGQLVDEGTLIVGRGKGGMVGLAGGQDGDQGLTVFVSYSHVDENLKDAIVKHLKPLERMKLVTMWHDRKLAAGDNWGDEINANLDKADIVLLLISVDFINSTYCYDIELDRALERHAGGKCKVIPVILRGCLWHHTPFAKIQAVPRDGKPITTWPDLDEALASVAEDVRKVAQEVVGLR